MSASLLHFLALQDVIRFTSIYTGDEGKFCMIEYVRRVWLIGCVSCRSVADGSQVCDGLFYCML